MRTRWLVAIAVLAVILAAGIFWGRRLLRDFELTVITRYMLDDLSSSIAGHLLETENPDSKSVEAVIAETMRSNWATHYDQDSGLVKEGWGNPVKIEYREDREFVSVLCTSAGADGEFDTDDDLRKSPSKFNRSKNNN